MPFSARPIPGWLYHGESLNSSVLVERFVHDIPGEDLAGIVFHHGRDVFLQQVGQLRGREVALCKPAGIVMVPDEAVSADLHAVSFAKRTISSPSLKVECALAGR